MGRREEVPGPEKYEEIRILDELIVPSVRKEAWKIGKQRDKYLQKKERDAQKAGGGEGGSEVLDNERTSRCVVH